MRFRRLVFGAVVSLAVAAGLGACSSSSKPANTVNSPASGSGQTTPPTTVPSGGGVSY